mgnify:CR=1 FL=1
MKRLIFLFLAVIVGVAAGVATAELRFRLLIPEAIAPPIQISDAERQPRVQVDSTEYDFGRMDLDLKGEHEFVLRNTGNAPLRMESGPTTCSCTVSSLGQNELPPGGVTRVRLEWKSNGQAGPYHQTAVIITNDAQKPRIELTIKGVMLAAIQASPAEVIFPQLSGTQATTQIVRLYGFRKEPLEVLGHSFADPALAKFFALDFAPLGVEDLAEAAGATSGVRVQITVKSGLPQGPLQQTITLRTNVAERPTVDIPIQGVVVSEISLFGPGWDAQASVLRIGSVSREQGAKRNLTILVRGRHTESVRFEIVESEPKFLHAEMASTQLLRGATASHTTLNIQIAPNSPPGRFMGTAGSPPGRIRIKTTHPDIPELIVSVVFVIEN